MAARQIPSRDFTKRALEYDASAPPGIDIYAYHTYPGYGRKLESGDYGLRCLRQGDSPLGRCVELVRHYPGIRSDIEFWDDEFNSIGTWQGSDDSVQAKYIPRGLIYNWAAGVRTFVWLLTAATDGNEFDDFGMTRGLRYLPDDFSPRPVYYTRYKNTNALFFGYEG